MILNAKLNSEQWIETAHSMLDGFQTVISTIVARQNELDRRIKELGGWQDRDNTSINQLFALLKTSTDTIEKISASHDSLQNFTAQRLQFYGQRYSDISRELRASKTELEANKQYSTELNKKINHITERLGRLEDNQTEHRYDSYAQSVKHEDPFASVDPSRYSTTRPNMPGPPRIPDLLRSV